MRTADGTLLLAVYGYAADGYKNGSLLTSAYFSSDSEGLAWRYASRIDVTEAMQPEEKKAGEGPGEPGLVTLADGRVLTALRVQGGAASGVLWMAYSITSGRTWSEPAPMKGVGADGKPMVPYGVWPQLLRMSTGALVLSSGRPGLGFWVSVNGDGNEWEGYDLEKMHSAKVPDDPFRCGSWGGCGTTSYTGLAEVEPGVALVHILFTSYSHLIHSLFTSYLHCCPCH